MSFGHSGRCCELREVTDLLTNIMKIETIPDAVVATPPAGVVAASIIGVSIQEWVLWLNLFYIILAVGWKLWNIYKEYRNGCK